MVSAIVGIGSNLGDSERLIARAISMIDKEVGSVIRYSSLYKTPPWGFDSDQNFINAVVEVRTEKSAENTLQTLLSIESKLGRKRDNSEGYSSRLMDLDLLDYGGEIINRENLQTPHPLLHRRAFVLVPLNEIKPNWKHPVLNKTPVKLIEQLDDKSSIVMLGTCNWQEI